VESLFALSHGAPASAIILVAIVATSLVGLYGAPALIERNLFRPYWLVPRSEYLTVVTSGFIHADLGHLFFNSFTFWAFAFSLERRIGSDGLVALYTFGLLVSNAGTWWRHHTEPDYRSLGASGAILAVLFASIVYFPTSSMYIMPIPVPIPAPVFAVGYLAYSYYASRQARGRVNHDAHLGGAVAGVLYVALTDADTLRQAWHTMMG
jgi:membrane associated rhomboid family serine protease